MPGYVNGEHHIMVSFVIFVYIFVWFEVRTLIRRSFFFKSFGSCLRDPSQMLRFWFGYSGSLWKTNEIFRVTDFDLFWPTDLPNCVVCCLCFGVYSYFVWFYWVRVTWSRNKTTYLIGFFEFNIRYQLGCSVLTYTQKNSILKYILNIFFFYSRKILACITIRSSQLPQLRLILITVFRYVESLFFHLCRCTLWYYMKTLNV